MWRNGLGKPQKPSPPTAPTKPTRRPAAARAPAMRPATKAGPRQNHRPVVVLVSIGVLGMRRPTPLRPKREISATTPFVERAIR